MLEDFRKSFSKSSKDYKSNNAYLGVVQQDKVGVQSLKILGSGPCHGAFMSSNLSRVIASGNTIEFLLSSVQNLQVGKEGVVAYFDWLVNRSPWRDVFITKDPEDIIKNGWVVSPNFPSNFVTSALIATRFVTESYTHVILERYNVYKDILAMGFNESEAFLFSYLFNRKRQEKSFPVTFVPVSSGHTVIGVDNPTESYCRNFLLGEAKGSHQDTFKAKMGYVDGIHNVWKTPKVANSSALNTWIKALRPKDATAKKNLNIFHKAPTSGWEIPNAEAFKSVIEQALERIYNAE